MTYLTSVFLNGLFSVAMGCLCALASLCFTLKVIRSKTHLYESLKSKLMNILKSNVMINNNTSEKIVVTVLMPVFNGARYLKIALGHCSVKLSKMGTSSG